MLAIAGRRHPIRARDAPAVPRTDRPRAGHTLPDRLRPRRATHRRCRLKTLVWERSPRPEAFEEIRRDGARFWVRAEARDWVLRTHARYGSLHEGAGSENPSGSGPIGRAPVHLVGTPPVRWAVRHAVRGGAVANLLGDRYLRVGAPRPFREAQVSEVLRRLGIPTPRVVAAAVYPNGAWYRADLVTEYLEDSADLGTYLFHDTGPGTPVETRATVLEEAGKLVGRMGALGIRHPDLNAKNLLVQEALGVPRIHLLDLDRCRIRSRIAPAAGWRMRRRLISSLRGWERKHGRPLLPGEWAALERGFGAGG